ncbi:MAG TPA: hypothetical protein GXX35_16005 [Thermoanaerobacterales bacterium]|nr:hypothetical protein [Thermoanaerobacterales bacterium]
MYYIYNVEKKDHICSYSFIDEIKLFGSVNGIIVKILQKIIPKNQNEENDGYKWKINMETDLPKIDLLKKAILIDLKPNAENNVSLYEIKNIFGHSKSGWTPMMFHLKALMVDEQGGWEQKKQFNINDMNLDNIFTFHHVYDGSIKNGDIIGRWIPPRPSSTNSALLWEETMDYFIECKKQI